MLPYLTKGKTVAGRKFHEFKGNMRKLCKFKINLLVLANMESYNAVMIGKEWSPKKNDEAKKSCRI